MIEVRQSAVFRIWMTELTDHRARARIAARIDRVSEGNPGDVKAVGDGVSELRIAYGPGYRVYFTRRGSSLVILLCGGDKSRQRRDIRTAKALVKDANNAP